MVHTWIYIYTRYIHIICECFDCFRDDTIHECLLVSFIFSSFFPLFYFDLDIDRLFHSVTVSAATRLEYTSE